MDNLINIITSNEIPAKYRETPIGKLLRYHNLEEQMASYTKAELLIGMCMDNRKQLRIPKNFAFVMRSGGANLRYNEFQISFAIGVGGVKHVALIGHNKCGMVNLESKKEKFVEGLVNNAGWSRETAEEHYTSLAPMYEVGNAIDFVTAETKRLRNKYPRVTFAPMFYDVDYNKIYLVKE